MNAKPARLPQAPRMRGPLFPPRPARRRMPLPEVHRRMSEWLRRATIRELIALKFIDQYCSRKLQL